MLNYSQVIFSILRGISIRNDGVVIGIAYFKGNTINFYAPVINITFT